MKDSQRRPHKGYLRKVRIYSVNGEEGRRRECQKKPTATIEKQRSRYVNDVYFTLFQTSGLEPFNFHISFIYVMYHKKKH